MFFTLLPSLCTAGLCKPIEMLENCCWIYANDFSIFVFIIFFPLSASSRVYYAFGLFVYRLVVVNWAVCFVFCFFF